jgi:ribonuclease E
VAEDSDVAPEEQDRAEAEGSEEPAGKRRGRRGGRSRKPTDGSQQAPDTAIEPDEQPMVEPVIADAEPLDAASETPAAPKTRRRPRAKAPVPVASEPSAEPAPSVPEAAEEPQPAERPKRKSRAKAPAEAAAQAPAEAPAALEEARPKSRRSRSKSDSAEAESPPSPKPDETAGEEASGEARRGGWWQRTFG